ncbi:hypothetical protein HDU83_007587 [Entophlyctis luteolus]|nr:hypothetical protein HDU83_007587 [Entophlyctis luteolus]
MQQLPPELLQLIFAHEHPASVLRLARLCRSAYTAIAHDEHFATANLCAWGVADHPAFPAKYHDSQLADTVRCSLFFVWPPMFRLAFAKGFPATSLRWSDLKSVIMLPEALGSFQHLHHLKIVDCSFVGSLPGQIGNLVTLKHLLIHKTRLSGRIPDALGNLSNLEVLQLSGNRFSGQIPDGLFCRMSKLEILNLDDNQFTGASTIYFHNG